MRRMILVCLALSALAAPAFPAELAGVTLSDTAKVGEQSLVLNGVGLRKKLFIKVYVGGLYLPAKQADAEKILTADESRRLVMHFVFSVSTSQMCDAWSEGLEDNTPNPSAEVSATFKTLCSYMEDIPKGNELVLTYEPATGTTVEVNGKAKGVLGGKATSDAILRTWIGPNPGPGADFKKAILGNPS
ncbi:MAG: chalcone isomerase family protein [Acidobacteriota bacterium]